MTKVQTNARPIAIQTEGALPIHFFLSREMMPDQATVDQLTDLAQASGLVHHVAVLPDVHRKGRNRTPTGTVIATRDTLLPRAVDTGINCGMRMIRTEIDMRDLDAAVIDRLFREFLRRIPVKKQEQEILSLTDVENILLQGGRWSQSYFGLSDAELDYIENRGTMPSISDNGRDVLDSMPENATKKGKRCFGTLGDGNHFLELQEITEILEPEIAGRLGLAQGQAFVMMHTGSRGVGSKMMKTFLQEFDEKYGNSNGRSGGSSIWSVPADSADGRRYAQAVSAASNFGFANRIAITEQVRAAFRSVLGDPLLQLPLLYDCAHVSIKPEQWNGDKLWLHRHGASYARPPSQCADHPVFSETGQPVPIPGSMGDDSYIGVADEGALAAFASLNHGAGRMLDKPDAGSRFSESQVEREMDAKRIRLYRYHTDNIAEQAPGSFKDIGAVMQAMSAFSLAKPVARLRPRAVLKG